MPGELDNVCMKDMLILFHSPGRFFASMVVKMIMAELILNYDLSWPEDVYKELDSGDKNGYRPPDLWLGGIVPNQKAKMVLRRRAHV